MIRYKIYQNQQQKGLNAGKWFARAVSDETFDLAKLAEHMSKHNSPYSGWAEGGTREACPPVALIVHECVDKLVAFQVPVAPRAAGDRKSVV